MEPLWNKLNLERPPTFSWKTNPQNFDTVNFIKSIKKIKNDSQSQDQLHTEAAILSRLIYRMKSKFRNDKGLKNMEKVNRILLNYLKLSLDKEYAQLQDAIIVGDSITLPTRQMLEYVLTRTQGCAKLLCRLESVSHIAANFFMARMRLGQAWFVSAISYSVISRIWFYSRYFVQRCCVWYHNMVPYLKKLQLVGVDWMPPKYCLPSDLKTWLSVPWIEDICGVLEPSQLPINDAEEKIKNFQVSKPVVIDIGEKISRESFKDHANVHLKVEKKIQKADLKNMKTTEDLQLLMSLDSCPGLEKLQWNIIKKRVNKKWLKIKNYRSKEKQKILLHKIFQSIKECMN